MRGGFRAGFRGGRGNRVNSEQPRNDFNKSLNEEGGNLKKFNSSGFDNVIRGNRGRGGYD